LTEPFKIGNALLEIDTSATEGFYLEQDKIVDDCACDDCRFFATEFVVKDLEIFKTLQSMGVDLEKNLQTEAGVWCVRSDNGSFLHCEQVYRAFGRLIQNDTTAVKYEMIQNGYKVNLTFIQVDNDKIDIVFLVDKQ
jgi:hypothetical protein